MIKILVADDEPHILMLLELLFKELGMQVITAMNGAEAIDKAKKEKPDLIITDIVMPLKTGFEVCRSIRNLPNISETPIIILSALGDEYNKITGFEEGADDYITKPFNTEELKARVKSLLFRYRQKEMATEDAQNQETIETIGITQILTGTPDLDARLYGGLPSGSNILVVGSVGKGKSSFVRTFIVEGLKSQEKCLYVAIDDDPKKIRTQLSRQLPQSIKEFEKKDCIRFVDAYSWSSFAQGEHEPFAVSGLLELNQLAGVISDASFELGQTVQKKMGGRRVIDSISSLLVNFELPAAQRFISQIARTAVSFGGVTTLFVVEEGTVPDMVLNNMKYLMDGIIAFGEVDGKQALRVCSMKWSKFSSDWVLL